MDTAELKKLIALSQQVYNEDYGVYTKLVNEKAEREKAIEDIIKEKDSIGIKKELLKASCIEARKSARDVLQNMSTNGLQSIMGEHLSLSVNLKETGASPEAEFVVRSEYDSYVVENDPADGDGGGVADVVSFSNFFSMNYLIGKKNVAPLLLDEPSKYVSAGHSENVAKFLFEISSYFKKQVFMVTHDKFLANTGDKAYLFELDSYGKTKVSEL